MRQPRPKLKLVPPETTKWQENGTFKIYDLLCGFIKVLQRMKARLVIANGLKSKNVPNSDPNEKKEHTEKDEGEVTYKLEKPKLAFRRGDVDNSIFNNLILPYSEQIGFDAGKRGDDDVETFTYPPFFHLLANTRSSVTCMIYVVSEHQFKACFDETVNVNCQVSYKKKYEKDLEDENLQSNNLPIILLKQDTANQCSALSPDNPDDSNSVTTFNYSDNNTDQIL